MKTTIEISDDLARSARAYAANENMTLRSLIEYGLRLAMRTDAQRQAFKLRSASVGGHGLQPPYRDSDWPRIRDSIYEGRGS